MIMFGTGGTVNAKNSSRQIGVEVRNKSMKCLNPEIPGNFTMSGGEIGWSKSHPRELIRSKL